MSNSPFDSESSSDNDLGFDDFIGILVAFLTIGTILFWSLSRKESNWNFGNLLSKAPAADKLQSSTDNNLTKLLAPSPEPNNTIPSRQPATDTDEIKPTRTNRILLERETVDAVIPPFLVPPARRLPPDLDKVIGDNSDGVPINAGDDRLKPIDTPVVVNTPIPTQTPTPIQAATPTQTPTPTPTPQAKATKPPTIPPPKDFADVPADFWAKPFVDKLSSRKIIEGYDNNTYRPQQPVNRAEFAAIIDKAFQTDLTNTNRNFADVPADFWAQNQIKNAVDKKFMKGYDANTFRPEQKIPRVQVIAALVSGLDKTLRTPPASPEQVLNIYKDADQIPQWAREQVAIATANGLIVNYPDRNLFRPNEEATRAEVASMIHQALVKMDKVEPVESQYVVFQ
jgi:hypothetical protein